MLGKLKMLPKLAEVGVVLSRRSSTKAPCQEVVKTEGLLAADYPILKCWPDDGGRFITLPLVFSRNPMTGKRNCGMYRMQVYDERTTGMHWQTHKQGADHYRTLPAQGGDIKNAGCGGARRRSGDHVLGHPAAAARD